MKCTNADNCRDLIAVLTKYPPTTPAMFALATDREMLQTSGGWPKLPLVYHRAVTAMENDICPIIIAVHFTGEAQ